MSRAQFRECLQGPIAGADACIVDKFANTLALSDQQVNTCVDTEDLEGSVRCMLRTHLLQQFESGIARMGLGEVQA